MGDRIGALMVWGANAERVCVPEKYAVDVPEDLDPAEVVSLVFPYMTAYQMLHRAARVTSGESVLMHGAAGRVGTAVLELGALAGLRLYGTASARDLAAVERLGAVAIDYRTEDFVARVRELTGDVVLDGIGGLVSLRSFRALRCGNPIVGDPGGRLVVMGNYATLAHGRKSRRRWIEWYAATAAVTLWGMASPRRRILGYRVQKLRIHHQDWFREDFHVLLELLRRGEIHPGRGRAPAAVRRTSRHELLEQAAAKESSCSYRRRVSTVECQVPDLCFRSRIAGVSRYSRRRGPATRGVRRGRGRTAGRASRSPPRVRGRRRRSRFLAMGGTRCAVSPAPAPSRR